MTAMTAEDRKRPPCGLCGGRGWRPDDPFKAPESQTLRPCERCNPKGRCAMTRHTFTFEDYRIARDNGGWSYRTGENPERARVRCNVELARAIHRMRPGGNGEVFPWWTPDPDPITPGENVWLCELFLVGDTETPVEVLGSVHLAGHPDSDPYARVVEAEMFMDLESRREANSVRGVN